MDLEHEYLQRVREELATLQNELRTGDVRERVQAASQALGIPEDLGLAAMYRAARRSGLTLAQFLRDLERALGSGTRRADGRH